MYLSCFVFRTFLLMCVQINTSESMGLKTTVVLTRMDHPVGKMIGNSLEVIEAIQCLNGRGTEDIIELVGVLGTNHTTTNIPVRSTLYVLIMTATVFVSHTLLICPPFENRTFIFHPILY